MTKRELALSFAKLALDGGMQIRFPAHHCKGFGYFDEKMPWCQAFLTTAYDFSGILQDLFGPADHSNFHVDCDAFKEALIKKGKFDCTKNHGGGHYVPKPGDPVFLSNKYTLKDITHVAMVYEYIPSSGDFRIIEGNYYDKMNTRVLNVNDKYVVGFGDVG